MPHTYSIGFYNLENLFDPLDNDTTLDKDYTPNGVYAWDQDKYNRKIENISSVISRIGRMRSEVPPVILGVCEVENESCLQDLVVSDALKDFNYQYIFNRSEDSRGINVCFLYQKDYFNYIEHAHHPVSFEIDGKKEFSRDVVHVYGNLCGEMIHVILNHWPSRTDGTKKTDFKRTVASKKVLSIIQKINGRDPKSKIIIMGDFNDDPFGNSLKAFKSLKFNNPMEAFQQHKKGSVKYKGKWIMFDQILFNKSLDQSEFWHYQEAHIFVQPELIQKSGRYRGAPKRTFIGTYHQGGYSDHFPVFIYFNAQNK